MAFSQIHISQSMMIQLNPIVPRSKTKLYKHQKHKKLALDLQLQTYQILTNNDHMLISFLSYFITTVRCYTAIDNKWEL